MFALRALIMAQITLNIYTSDQIFKFVLFYLLYVMLALIVIQLHLPAPRHLLWRSLWPVMLVHWSGP